LLTQTPFETQLFQAFVKLDIPSPRSLSKSIKSFAQLQHMMLFTLLCIPFWLSYINFLLKLTMQES
jgi:hypothetical protein